MSRSTRSPLRITVRAAVTAALGLALVGVSAAPALAEEAGVITKRFGENYPTYQACYQQGLNAQARENADGMQCYLQPDNKYDGYIWWYTS